MWVEHRKSQPTDDKRSLKGAWSLSRDLFFWKICDIALCIFVIGELIAKTSNLMYRLNVQVTAYGQHTVPDRGVVRSCDPLKNFWGSNHMTGTAVNTVTDHWSELRGVTGRQILYTG